MRILKIPNTYDPLPITHYPSQKAFFLSTTERNNMPLATPQVLYKEDIYYPDTDGKPMADNDFQRDCMTDLISELKIFFQEQQDVYVSGDIFIYYEKDNPNAKVAPDVFVVFGVSKQKRRIYQTWVEGKTPDVVFEIASPTTFQKDEKFKPELYQRLGIQEYFQYDPTGECMQPALRGCRLDETGQYQALIAKPFFPGGIFSLTSQQLGLELHLSQGVLKIFDPKTGTYLFTPSEEAAARQLAEKQVKNERKQKEWAQQHTKLLLEEIEQERQQKEQALKQAEQEKERDRQEKELLQQQANQLAEQLRALGINPDEIIQKTP